MKKLLLFVSSLAVTSLFGVTAADVENYRKAAEQGDAKAQYNLSSCYFKGDGVRKDIEQAILWLRRSAKQGDAQAQFNLGVCYEKGYGVSKDQTQAVYWYRKSAEQGLAQAQFNLGN